MERQLRRAALRQRLLRSRPPLGFRVIFLSDANAALTDAEHNAALNALAAWHADIRTASQAIELLRAGMPKPAAVGASAAAHA